ncbi:hypothetical protein [Polyangium fumosum]|uniref:Uncharacterized protein n=1 Tax=Polyangium fumosum TaxID=889272 RepID=A0A4U1J606_9BACT|nr:hypothetical protein [Polyangium fumosum]TKD02215.1 hypothetical protein E8A74_29005 [Polyangium fumosum]
MNTERALLLAILLGLPACASYASASADDRCGPPPAMEKPLASLGHDPKPFEMRHAPEKIFQGKPGGYLYRFEREDSGTTESLRAVHMFRGGRILVVGDHGTALLRDPKAGWQPEATGTTENLHALVPVIHYKDGETITEDRRKNHPSLAVGSNGMAVFRDLSGVWRTESTGTSAHLFALRHLGPKTVAVGAGGVMVERSLEGVWRTVETRTTADLYALGSCGGYLCAVGAGGAMVVCKAPDGELVCIPRPPPTQATLRVVDEHLQIMGDGVWLSYVPTEKTEPRPPASFAPWSAAKDLVAGEEIRATEHNHWGGISEMLAVGRRGTVWFQGGLASDRNHLEKVKLPFEVDFHDVAYELVDGFLVGDKGTIVHLGVQDFVPDHICLL